MFQEIINSKFLLCFPEKSLKVSNDDQPWITHKLKALDRKRKRIYQKSRRSTKWKEINKQLKKEVKSAKANFYKKMAADLKEKILTNGILPLNA